MSPYNGRIVAYAQDFERCLLLCRTLCELLVGYDKLSCIHFERDIRVVIHTSMYVNDIVGDVNSQHLDPDAVLLRANALYVRTVLPVYVAQHAFYGRGLLSAYLAQQHPAFGCWGRRLRIARGSRFLHTFRLRFLHCKIEGRDNRVLGIVDIEREKSAVFGDDRQVCFCCEIPHGRLHPHDVFGPVGLACYDVHRADVDIRDGRREEDVYSLGESRFDTQGPDLRRRFRCRSCRNLYRRDCGDDQGQINKVSFHFTAVLKSIIADGWL